MNLIVAVDEHWGIGKDGELLARISEDMKFFKLKTIGNTIVLGRKTMETFPGGKPLPGRRNVVLSRNKDYQPEGAEVIHSVEEFLEKIGVGAEVYIVGGGSVYNQFLPYCDSAYVTKIKKSFEADTFIQNLDADAEWNLCEQSELKNQNGLEYSFTSYERKKR